MLYLLNSKISHRHRLLLNVTVKINLKRNYRYVALSNLSVCYTWKNREKSYMNNKFKKISSNMEWRVWITWWIIFCVRFSILFWVCIYKKQHGEKDVNSSIGICINKMEYRIAFKIETRFYLVFLTSKTKKLLGSTKSKITKNKNCENVSNLENTELILVHCNVANNNYWQNSEVLYTFVPK